jgi:hypothetical protein
LNSDLIRFVYRKKFNALKVLRGNLEALPLPDFSQSDQQAILLLVDEWVATRSGLILDEINTRVYRYFDLNEKEIRYITGEGSPSRRPV